MVVVDNAIQVGLKGSCVFGANKVAVCYVHIPLATVTCVTITGVAGVASTGVTAVVIAVIVIFAIIVSVVYWVAFDYSFSVAVISMTSRVGGRPFEPLCENLPSKVECSSTTISITFHMNDRPHQ